MSDSKPCCRLDQEFICGIGRERSGISSGELDYTIRTERALGDLPNVIRETERLLEQLKSYLPEFEARYLESKGER